jgi:hypothetical protein
MRRQLQRFFGITLTKSSTTKDKEGQPLRWQDSHIMPLIPIFLSSSVPVSV